MRYELPSCQISANVLARGSSRRLTRRRRAWMFCPEEPPGCRRDAIPARCKSTEEIGRWRNRFRMSNSPQPLFATHLKRCQKRCDVACGLPNSRISPKVLRGGTSGWNTRCCREEKYCIEDIRVGKLGMRICPTLNLRRRSAYGAVCLGVSSCRQFSLRRRSILDVRRGWAGALRIFEMPNFAGSASRRKPASGFMSPGVLAISRLGRLEIPRG